MLNMEKNTAVKNERGMATIEVVPLIFIFVVLLSYSLGAFGVIHTAILHSIAARNYAFEVFRGRSNLTYFRDNKGAQKEHYRKMGARLFTIISENRPEGVNQFMVSERSIRMGMPYDTVIGRDQDDIHEQKVFENIQDGKRNETVGVNPVWIRVMYGICLNARCGD